MTDTKNQKAKDAALTTAVRVELTGLTRPATFKRLPDALAALWESIRLLPFTAFEADCFRHFLMRPDAEVFVLEFLNRDGFLALRFTLPDGSHTMRMSLAPPMQVVATGATGGYDAPRSPERVETAVCAAAGPECRSEPYAADRYAACAS